MRIILAILFLSLTAHAGLPRWWQESKGNVQKVKIELAELIENNAELNKNLIKVDAKVTELLKREFPKAPEVAILPYMISENQKQATENIKEVNGKISEWKDVLESMGNMDISGGMGHLFKALLTGDPTAIIMAILSALGIGGTLHQRKGKNEAVKEAKTVAEMNDPVQAMKHLMDSKLKV